MKQSKIDERFPITVKLKGILGQALERSLVNRLKKVDYSQLVEPFKRRNEVDGAWRCEFWGKIVRSAILTNYFLQDGELAQIIKKTVLDMIETQTPDGCISSYPTELQTTEWDIWGRKYVLLGLLRYYDYVLPDETVKKCCCGILDHLMTQVGANGKSIIECGEHGGLAASSILGAVVGVYRITGEKRYLDFARYIVMSGCSKKHNIFAAIRVGIIPDEIGNGKAYEMTSCFQGLAELYRFDPRPEYLDACEKYYRAVHDREIFITGVGGGKDQWGEYWFNGTFKQTMSDVGGLGETCVTTTWLHYCERIMELNSDISAMDAAECSLYNGILGAMSPDGSSWIHVNPTPLTGGGCKMRADDQIGRGFGTPFGGNDCCIAQGPEALALASRLAVTSSGSELTLNFFEPLVAELPGRVRLEVEGEYPITHIVRIHLSAPKNIRLRVRIPSFIHQVTLNGLPIEFYPGKYLVLNRKWQHSDELKLEFDFSLQEIPAPDSLPYFALKRGPLVMAVNSQTATFFTHPLVQTTWKGIELCDYASAGNAMCPDNTLTVWLPKSIVQN